MYSAKIENKKEKLNQLLNSFQSSKYDALKRKEISEEEANKLGAELYSKISKKSFNDKWDSIIDLIYKGANLNYRTENKGDSVLILCARRNYKETFVLLVLAGANINIASKYGTNAVMTSARHGNKEILELLILLEAELNAKRIDGDTALMSAKIHDQEECYHMLLDAGAHFLAKNYKNETAKDISFHSTVQHADQTKYEKIYPQGDKLPTHQDALKLIEEANSELEKILKI